MAKLLWTWEFTPNSDKIQSTQAKLVQHMKQHNVTKFYLHSSLTLLQFKIMNFMFALITPCWLIYAKELLLHYIGSQSNAIS